MTFAKIDAGDGRRSKEAKGRDCTVRALTVAIAVSYETAWDMLYEFQAVQRTNAFDLGGLLDQRLSESPGIRLSQRSSMGDPADRRRWTVKQALSFPAVKGKPRMTPAAFVKKYPTGRYVLSLAHHVVAVRDGVVIDTWDCTKKCVYKAWEIELPKEGAS